MKFLVAITLVVVTIVTAESPDQRATSQRQTASPSSYQPRGWRPSGRAFNPTIRLQNQEQAPAEPSPSYGPPPSASYGPPEAEPTTTEQPTTTEGEIEVTTIETQAENIEFGARNEKVKSAKLEKEPLKAPGPVYVLLPQGQSLIYAAPSSVANAASAPLVDGPTPKKDVELVSEEPKLAPVQAIPALAKIQAPIFLAKYEQVPQLLQLQQIQAVPVARYASSLSQTSVYTPYSASYVQVYQ